MTEHFPILILLVPLFGALIVVLLGRERPEQCWVTSLVSLGISSIISLFTIIVVFSDKVQTIRYRMGGWEPEANGYEVGIELRVDILAALVVFAVTFVGFVNTIYSKTRAEAEVQGKVPFFYALIQLLIVGLCGIVMTNDAFNLYVLIEITSLTSYALIAMGNRRAVLSSFNYVIMGTIGASFYLLGVGYLYIKTGTLNIDDIRMVLGNDNLWEHQSIVVAFIFIMLGVWTKMAFFPLHGWLPNAYAYAPSMTGTFMAPLMTKVMVYVMIRVMLWLFGYEFVYSGQHVWKELIIWMSVLAIVAGSLLALARTDIKKMLTYLIVAEVGYMVGGAWLGNVTGQAGAFYHILSDAAMTFCLFIAASIIVLRVGDSRVNAFDNLFRKMPLTMIGFTVGALSMIGLPPTCGFFSKWYLISGGIEAGQWEYVCALIFSSLVNAIIFFRIFERAYFGKIAGVKEDLSPSDSDANPDTGIKEVPWSMLVPLFIASGFVLLLGIMNRTLFEWIQTALEVMNT
ncbi:MAG TPA: monovalent cation/H+ antiporter subunit D family protein [Verrucomicrobia bacterium]|nr:monovalent cation/H+ antiporter subunit D family protein [Verrucomicrobiales bacterium]HIL55279.1 monovalent cation/H+ antiporter subunit D family protein [Verrucomicrobiota bacterium]